MSKSGEQVEALTEQQQRVIECCDSWLRAVGLPPFHEWNRGAALEGQQSPEPPKSYAFSEAETVAYRIGWRDAELEGAGQSQSERAEREFELHQGGEYQASAFGPYEQAWAEIQHLAMVYGQDGPVEIYEVTRRLATPPVSRPEKE